MGPAPALVGPGDGTGAPAIVDPSEDVGFPALVGPGDDTGAPALVIPVEDMGVPALVGSVEDVGVPASVSTEEDGDCAPAEVAICSGLDWIEFVPVAAHGRVLLGGGKQLSVSLSSV